MQYMFTSYVDSADFRKVGKMPLYVESQTTRLQIFNLFIYLKSVAADSIADSQYHGNFRNPQVDLG